LRVTKAGIIPEAYGAWLWIFRVAAPGLAPLPRATGKKQPSNQSAVSIRPIKAPASK
jgi:hypothetical protein